ncbi:DNA/RNA polymerase [Yamadazyma tenuis ATCC 10573]|uniref:DNA-directed RNA polymerase n=2 Tax=Candida tenuis TaxID=2315449 RepID=G3B4C1_CANTC|nr:DNA/RNA polymerase [Yamadazyma tenuis ATCC 10573]EGV63947.1 DNA/RNA polymerase [Yamadazyma tenuis ATCC 10573]
MSSSQSSSNPSSTSKQFPGYSIFLPDLKNKEVKERNLHRKSFEEIDPGRMGAEGMDPSSNNGLTWTSQYDSVVRQPFAKDVIHLQSLLDALLSSKNFTRADKILQAIYPLSTSQEEFMYSINKYLEVWSQQDSATLEGLENYLLNFTKDARLLPNDRTYAILITKALQVDSSFKYNKYLNEIKSNINFTRKVLGHIDVLGIDNLTKIFQENSITEKHIPIDFGPLYDQINSTEDSSDINEDYFSDENFSKLNIPSISKEAEELRSVDSFGLKVVRHTLLGLKSTSEGKSPIIDDLMKNLEKDLQGSVIHNFSNSEKRDYFALYKLLKTDQDREKFNEALDLFNRARQRTIELRGADSAKEKWKHDYEEMQRRGSIHFAKSLNARLYEWYEMLLPFVKEEVNQCHKIMDGEITIQNAKSEDRALVKERSYYAPYLTLVTPEKMCAVTILELLRLNSTGGIADGMRTARALISVGKAIELEYKSQKLMESEKKSISKKSRSAREWNKIFRVMNNYSKDSDNQAHNEWDNTLHAKIGSILTSLLIHVAKVPVKGTDPATGKTVTGSQPAFFHTYQYLQGQKLGVLKLHKNIIKQLSVDVDGSLLQPHFLPMLTPPRKWSSYNEGGYLFSQNTLVRTRDSPETLAYLKAASQRGDLDKVYDGLNVLGNTPWTVNRKVLEVMTKFWNTGDEFLDIPPVVDEPELPEPVPSNAEPNVLREYQRKVRLAINISASAKSQRCDTNYKLEIARAFLGEKMFFPHNIDFRGRAYPMSPHFNHLGNDLTRSLFLFWDGKQLGERGLWWLKVHLANLYGVDKIPLEERAQFTETHLDKIRESAETPFDKDAWWTKGEKPWQVLACCFELNEAYKLEDPTQYVSHVPVHQDGSCNGLQHYAALGGDIEGARQVNLYPADRPQDVYSSVASIVQQRVDADAEAGEKHAVFLKDKINRRVVKQTVMTNVYGVTFVGAREQIKKQLKVHFDSDSEENSGEYAQYLTQHVFAAVRELFSGAHLIQDWLGEAARIISKSVRVDYEDSTTSNDKPNHVSSVIWTTPLGLPCVQPYRTIKKQIIKTNLQDVAITDPFGASLVDARKQKTALPPNFVHSLDATHMLMTASTCKYENISFASVHDSYWTHASDIDVLSKILREQFIKLHSENLIQKVKDEFEARYKGFLQVVTIPRDHELAKKIQDVRRKIATDLNRALTVADEIHLEKKRQELLASDDPEAVKMGKELVTTVSSVEEYDLNEVGTSSIGLPIFAPISFPPVPPRGDLDVNVVKDSTYFFS